jgi:hypothetical protein
MSPWFQVAPELKERLDEEVVELPLPAAVMESAIVGSPDYGV